MKRYYPEFTYKRIGGIKQLICENHHHLEALLTLDETHWAMTGVSASALDMDKDFLKLIDSDNNGRIRTDEVRNSVSWLLALLKDRSGIDTRSSKIFLDAIDTSTAMGKDIYEAANLVVSNLGTPDKRFVTLGEIDNDAGILAQTRQNGDGVIPAEAAETPAQRQLIERILKVVPGVKDLSGKMGVNADSITDYKNMLQRELAHRQDANAQTGSTARLLDAAEKAEAIIDDFFVRAGLIAFCPTSPDPAAPAGATAMMDFLAEAPVAPVTGTSLSPDAPFNPLHRECMKNFFAARDRKDPLELQEWQKLKALLPGYILWRNTPPEAAGDGMSDEELAAEINNPEYDTLQELFVHDLAAAKIIEQKSNLRKLLLFQRDMLHFVNNFANLSDFFTPQEPSALQAGTLVMDARKFTLTVNVDNVAAHKKIAVNSNICTAYLKVDDSVTGFIAAGVTAGTMRRIFIGKRGIFISRTGKVSDAEVIDFIQQPVSITEAMLQPFINLGKFISKQADKIMTTNTQNIQKSMEADMAKSVQTTPAAPAQPQQNNSLGMLLAGGGIGIAAIGSSIALLTKTIHEASPWTLPLIILGVIVIFGGPAVIISLIKLYKRNIGSFLEAGNAAVNHPMRMSRKLGKFFCAVPRRPK